MKNPINKTSLQTGFTLIELMVGLVIGLIATVVIMQTFASFEGNKRSTTGTSDAQTNGSIALYTIQRELQFAGYGLPLMSGTMPTIAKLPNEMTYADYSGMTETEILAAQAAAKTAYDAKVADDTLKVQAGEVYSALKCDSSATLPLDLDNDPATADVALALNAMLTPVSITNGASDTIFVRYGTTMRGALPTRISNVTPPNYVGVDNNMGCRQGDVVLVTPDSNLPGGTACVATKLTAATTNTSLEAATTVINVDSNSGMDVGDRLACLGQIRQMTFDVSGNQLQKNNIPVISEIVNLQAQYGTSATANSEVVTQWRDATGAWAALSVANRNRIKAVRIAVVARNSLLEKDVVSQACTGTATGPAKVCAWGADINLAGTDVGGDWNRYRYRVYEVVVPLRNILAATPQL